MGARERLLQFIQTSRIGGRSHIARVEDNTGVPVPRCAQQVTGAPGFAEGLSIR